MPSDASWQAVGKKMPLICSRGRYPRAEDALEEDAPAEDALEKKVLHAVPDNGTGTCVGSGSGVGSGMTTGVSRAACMLTVSLVFG